MNQMKANLKKKLRRAHRVRARIGGTAARPRLSVFRSNQHLYAQLIDDVKAATVCAASDSGLQKAGGAKKEKGVERAKALGRALAARAREKHITAAVFDRGAYRYHGQVKALAEGAREGGLEF